MRFGLLARVAAVLDSLGAPYAVVGAAALAAHGVARSTFDVDLLTTSRQALDEKAWASLSSDPHVAVMVRRGDAEDPLAGVVRVAAPGDASGAAGDAVRAGRSEGVRSRKMLKCET